MGQTNSQSSTYSQSSQTYSQPNGQQMTIAQETIQAPGGSKTVVTKTMTQPVITQSIGSGYNNFGTGYGKKKRSTDEEASNNPADLSSQPSILTG